MKLIISKIHPFRTWAPASGGSLQPAEENTFRRANSDERQHEPRPAVMGVGVVYRPFGA